MKENISPSERKYIKRRLATTIKNLSDKFSVIVVSGARQVGKSTMLLNEFSDFTYFTLDDFDTIDLIKNDPMLIFKQHQKVIIDEAQKFPEIFNIIKIVVDKFKDRRILISGSSNLLLMKNITESLAGRALYFELFPFTFGEFHEKLKPTNFLNLFKGEIYDNFQNLDIDLYTLMLKGFMPANIFEGKIENVNFWIDGYIKTYLERDLRQLSQIESLIDFRKLMQLLALRTGNILRQSDIAKDSQLSAATVSRYIKLLEISNIIERIPGYFNNKGKRLVKSPKIFFIDPAITIFLSGYFDRQSLISARELGGFFETMIFLHLKSLCSILIPPAKLYYWRTVSGRVVDFIIEYGRKIIPVEVKLSDNVRINDAKNLLNFITIYPETEIALILYSGDKIKWLHSKIVALPWWCIDR